MERKGEEMIELTKDDLFEIETVLDIYAGLMNETLNKFCQTAIHQEALMNAGIESDMVIPIAKLKDAMERIQEIRDKLQQHRTKR